MMFRAGVAGLGFGLLLASSAATSAGPRNASIARQFHAYPATGRRELQRPRRASATHCSSNYGTSGNFFVGVNDDNFAAGLDSAVLGGAGNEACDADSGTGAGGLNIIGNSGAATNSFVAGGYKNQITSTTSFIGGGSLNSVSGNGAVIVGGGYEVFRVGSLAVANEAGGIDSFVGAGDLNEVTGNGSFVGAGGYADAATGHGNPSNDVTGLDSFVGSGDANDVGGNQSFVGGGDTNVVAGNSAFLGGGGSNVIDADYAFVGGGAYNKVSGNGSAIVGGDYVHTQAGNGTIGNQVSGTDSFVGAGDQNTISADQGFVGAGSSNSVAASGGFIGGGTGNAIASSGSFASIIGGLANTASGTYASVIGGYKNVASGAYAIVAGGNSSTASGTLTYAAGYHAKAVNNGSFVWSDYASGSATVSDKKANQFVVRASGGTTIYSNEAATSGVSLTAGSGTWASLSDRNAKTAIALLDDASILAKVASLPISAWQYKTEHGVRHVGPMAQDFYAAFGTGTDDRHITSIDEDGVALSAIKALRRENLTLRADARRKDGDIARLQSANDLVQSRLATLEAKVAALTSHGG
jgi:trimeric autotransporter adhesin